MVCRRLQILFFLLAVAAAPVSADPVIREIHGKPVPVPPGNRLKSAPPVPGATIKRLLSTRSTIDRKYSRVLRQLSANRKLIAEIRRVAALYDIDPIHMIAALVGEHTFNVDAFDTMQAYTIKAASYLKLETRFEYRGEPVTRFVQRPEFAGCRAITESDAVSIPCCSALHSFITCPPQGGSVLMDDSVPNITHER